MIRQTINRARNWNHWVDRALPVAVFLGVMVLFHVLMREPSYGDAPRVFGTLTQHDLLFAVLYTRFIGWTSRILIEGVLISLATGPHFILFALIDTLMWLLLAYSLQVLTNWRRPWLVVGLLLCYPFQQMNSAGWMATLINYLWPVALGTYALSVLWRLFTTGHLSWATIAMSTLALLFATNFETYAVFYLIILIGMAVLIATHRKFTKHDWVTFGAHALVCAFNLALALFSPGNANRTNTSTILSFKDFPTYSLVDKAALGATTTMQALVSGSLLFALFAVALAARSIRTKFWPISVLGLIPLTVIGMMHAPRSLLNAYLPTLPKLIDTAMGPSPVLATNYLNGLSYVPLVFAIGMMGLTLAAIVISASNLESALIAGWTFVAGLITRIAMGFSPTVYVSSDRTFLFLLIVLIYLTVQFQDQPVTADATQATVDCWMLPIVTLIALVTTVQTLSILLGFAA